MFNETFWIIYHSTNRFLGSTTGELFKHSFELVLFTFTTYMIVSEYLRNRDNLELKELGIGFGLLSLSKLGTTLTLGIHIFGGLLFTHTFAYIYILESTIELWAILSLIKFVTAPVIKDNKTIQKILKFGLIFVLLLTIGIYTHLITVTNITEFYDLRESSDFAIINLIKTIFLISGIIIMWKYYTQFKQVDKRHRSIFHAFILYAISPLFYTINYFAFAGQNPALIIISHPFPFIAVSQFTRVIFLKTADKAQILDRLNITEKKYLKAQEISELKDEFVSIVSHELKTPLTSINLYASILEKGTLGPSNQRQLEAFQTIKQECTRLSNLIQDILDLSKLDNKNVKLNYQIVDFYDLVENSLLLQIAQKKQIIIHNTVPLGSKIRVDPDKIKQVLINLQSNAIKFTEQEGSITIGFAHKPKTWEFWVADTGIGIPKNKIPKLFDKFYQVEDHLTRQAGGTGLGLAIVKRIADLHNAKIHVNSTVGKGSIFRLTFGKKY